MKKTDIFPSWGTTYELDNGAEFFQKSSDFWREELYKRKLIVFKRVKFARDDFVRLSSYFGKVWEFDDYVESKERISPVPINDREFSLGYISNKSSSIGMSEMPWHADIPNKPIGSFPHRSLWMVKNPNPESGITTWLNIEDVVDKLPDDLKDLASRMKIIQQNWHTEDTGIQHLDFIKTHPITGKQSLRLNYYNDPTKKITNGWIKNIVIDGEIKNNCQDYLKPFVDFVESQPEMLYGHKWDTFDIVIYDNWSFIHNRTQLKFDDKLERLFLRANIDHIPQENWNSYKDSVRPYFAMD